MHYDKMKKVHGTYHQDAYVNLAERLKDARHVFFGDVFVDIGDVDPSLGCLGDAGRGGGCVVIGTANLELSALRHPHKHNIYILRLIIVNSSNQSESLTHPQREPSTYLPPRSAPFIASSAIAAASGVSNSIKQKPLCLPVAGSTDMLTLLIDPNWPKTALI